MKHAYVELTWPEVRDAAESRRVVLIPLGSLEAHEHGTPMDTDIFVARYLCERAARERPDLLISMPASYYGVRAPGGRACLSISSATYIAYLTDIGTSLARQGFGRLLFVNGHASNAPFANIAARQITNTTPAAAALVPWRILLRSVSIKTAGGVRPAQQLITQSHFSAHLRPELDARPTGKAAQVPASPSASLGPLIFPGAAVAASAPAQLPSEALETALAGCVQALIELASDFRRAVRPPRRNFQATTGE